MNITLYNLASLFYVMWNNFTANYKKKKDRQSDLFKVFTPSKLNKEWESKGLGIVIVWTKAMVKPSTY